MKKRQRACWKEDSMQQKKKINRCDKEQNKNSVEKFGGKATQIERMSELENRCEASN